MSKEIIFCRAYQLLNLADYSHYIPPFDLGPLDVKPPTSRQYILRMMIRRPGLPFLIPDELRWTEEAILKCAGVQAAHGLDPAKDFIYMTVRHGLVTSKDDDFWHVDGFSMRIPQRPEQNYLYSDCYPTEFLAQEFDIPPDFDPLRHNLCYFFQDRADLSKVIAVGPCRLTAMDPYLIHRRPPVSSGKIRTLLRISFVPIEIEDDACQENPLMETKRYGRFGADWRDKLIRYEAAK